MSLKERGQGGEVVVSSSAWSRSARRCAKALPRDPRRQGSTAKS